MYDDPILNKCLRAIATLFCLWAILNLPLLGATTTSAEVVTAQDQIKGSKQDVETTRKIRSAIVKRNLSTEAKNIEIVTLKGDVTLIGNVENAAEKEAVTTIAKKYLKSSSTLTNELKIKKIGSQE